LQGYQHSKYNNEKIWRYKISYLANWLIIKFAQLNAPSPL
jgi:hypothetical protein